MHDPDSRRPAPRCGARSFLLAIALASGCADEPATPAAPPSEFEAAPVEIGVERCFSCGMSIEDARFLAQARLADGRTASFDDPGCVAIELAMGRLDASELGFRHHLEERWLLEDETSFVRHEATPMRFGFAAVEQGAGELTFRQVRDELARRFALPR